MEGLLRFRHNAMNISAISTFENIKGGINNNCRDVYFVRALGTNAAYAEEVKKLDNALSVQRRNHKGYYDRIKALPRLQSVEDSAFYSDCYQKWQDSPKREAVTKATQKNKALAGMLGHACAVVEDLYFCQVKHATESMTKNFIIKLLFWYDFLFHNEYFQWEEKSIVKIAAENIEKKQEYLFFYLVTLMGCDVLLLQGSRDIGEEEERLGLSTHFVLGDFSQVSLPEYEWQDTFPVKEAEDRKKPAEAPWTKGNDRIVVQLPRRERSGQKAAAVTATTAQTGMAVNTRPSAAGETLAEKSFEELASLASSVVLLFVHDQRGEMIKTGSGIMIGRDGYILTNNHVAQGGKYYSVKIEDDETEYKTDEIIKYHTVLDLALIRIERRLNPIPIYKGDKKLVRGQKVVAIGSPLGLFNSVSDGIISGFRKINHVDMIQFTAPISHGSSGGAVLNMQGEVIGISTAGIDSGQNINLAMGYECINMFIKGFV